MIGPDVLQRALFSRLANDTEIQNLLGGPQVFDAPNRNAQFPYISFGEFSSTDWSTANDIGAAVIFSLNCFGKGTAREEVHQIKNRVTAILETELQLESGAGVHLVLLHPISERTSFDSRRSIIQSTLRYRALIEPELQ